MEPAQRQFKPARGGSYLTQDFDRSPFTVAWEITRACALACVHCRAAAIHKRDPRELTTGEARGSGASSSSCQPAAAASMT